jgi:ATP-dependent helicase HrpB
MSQWPVLPIDPLLDKIATHFNQHHCGILQSPPGTGKTTRVPQALLKAPYSANGELLVLSPRRLAARMAAARVAEEMTEPLGKSVGYQVRFSQVAGRDTRLRFITEGILTRRLLSDPQLQAVNTVILDEFHERHLQTDLALALLRRLQLTTRPDLRLMVMSATLDTAAIAEYLGNCVVFNANSQLFDVTTEYLKRSDERPLELQVVSALERVVAAGLDGDILVFLPGAAEIRRIGEACSALAKKADLLMLKLHGDLPLAEQQRVVSPSTQYRLILSTNVAESSITIEGVTVVIDAGLARVMSHSPWSGLPLLQTKRISQASAIQRAGRAGRLRAGRCLRLYTEPDYETRPAQETAEIQRADLAETLLTLRANGVLDLATFPWFEVPAHEALQAADTLLHRLGAIDQKGRLTTIGQRMLRFPLHPRQARLIVEAENHSVSAEGALLAALMGERDIRTSQRASLNRQSCSWGQNLQANSDLLLLLDLYQTAAEAKFSPQQLDRLGLDTVTTLSVAKVYQQLLQLTDQTGLKATSVNAAAKEQALLISLLTAYPDRVARTRLGTQPLELQLANNTSAQLSANSVVCNAPFIIAIDVEQRTNTGRSLNTVVRIASAIEWEWLLELFIDDLKEIDKFVWNESLERVERVQSITYESLTLDETRQPAPAGEKAAEVLARAVLDKGLSSFIPQTEVERFLSRVHFTAEHFPQAAFPHFSQENLFVVVKECAMYCTSFAQLRKLLAPHILITHLQQKLSMEQQRLLQTAAPERIKLPSGYQARIEYVADQPPWLASPLQNFFGLRDGPKIAQGRVAVVLHLLAPNQRAVQVTKDLASFWQGAYNQIRKELSRRYPRHYWPDNPLIAMPMIKPPKTNSS